MLIEGMEQGVPLEDLDLRSCVAADRAIQFLRKIAVGLQEPLAVQLMTLKGTA